MRNIKAVRRIRAKVSGTEARPRLCVSVSLKHMRAQLIDDVNGKTIASVSTESNKELAKKSMIDKAAWLGSAIAELGKKAKVKSVVFDRGGFIYTGKVEAVAAGAREGGLKF